MRNTCARVTCHRAPRSWRPIIASTEAGGVMRGILSLSVTPGDCSLIGGPYLSGFVPKVHNRSATLAVSTEGPSQATS